ncbi:MAG: hypothetical protein ABEJ72_06515 [Candidatus Aenigmatarchaeota archaeon]
MELTAAQAREMLEEAGADEVDQEAAEEFAQVLENYMGYISEEAVARADGDERPVTEEDIISAEE